MKQSIYTSQENGKVIVHTCLYRCSNSFYFQLYLFSSLLGYKIVSYFIFSSASNRIINAKDHASIQLSIAEVDPQTGRMTENSKMYALCGAIRLMGESDDCIVRLTKKDGILSK